MIDVCEIAGMEFDNACVVCGERHADKIIRVFGGPIAFCTAVAELMDLISLSITRGINNSVIY